VAGFSIVAMAANCPAGAVTVRSAPRGAACVLLAEFVRMRPLLIAEDMSWYPAAAAEPVATMAGSSSPFMAVAVAVAPVLVLLFE
jgi:hypothetical protein